LLAIVLSVLLCWPLYCLPFSVGHCIVGRQYNGQQRRTDNTMANREGQTIQWPTEKDRQCNDQQRRADNTMANREGQTIQWPTERDRKYNGQQRRTDNTMANRGQTIQ
jgi:hypothetical protein